MTGHTAYTWGSGAVASDDAELQRKVEEVETLARSVPHNAATKSPNHAKVENALKQLGAIGCVLTGLHPSIPTPHFLLPDCHSARIHKVPADYYDRPLSARA